MDHKQSLEFRTGKLKALKVDADKRYDYARNGLLNKALPKILFKGNPILVAFLQLIDIQLIVMFKLIDRIQNFKNIASY